MPDELPLIIEAVTHPTLAAEVAFVAAVTFPLACPAHSTRDDIAAHIARSLAPHQCEHWINDPGYTVLVVRENIGSPLIGYALLIHGAPIDDDVRAAVPGDAVTEISKMYVLPHHHGPHGGRPAHRLMEAALDAARTHGSTTAWLGVNQLNERAQRYYAKMGFARVGTKSFHMNGIVEHDYVLARDL
ncbi:MAG: GNAT family N-acetyltransferase [Gordonia sp. (in: high G+C Gram-positive bacteria)]|uniref:GNAT family N-acetyltransferase n=1 Tax=Gordonia sp. (in: high G+C Gram-positive bacteria) TaxID=84139 RepID=UPI003BB674BF